MKFDWKHSHGLAMILWVITFCLLCYIFAIVSVDYCHSLIIQIIFNTCLIFLFYYVEEDLIIPRSNHKSNNKEESNEIS